MKIWEIALDKPLYCTFDYLSPKEIKDPALYCRVLVPFGTKQLLGLFIKKKSTSSIPEQKLKTIIKVLDKESLFSPEILSLCHFAANYYQQPLGPMLFAALPKYIKQYQRPEPLLQYLQPKNPWLPSIKNNNHVPLQLTIEQQSAITNIKNKLYNFNIFLLDGVTGSGKTEVYLQIINLILNNKKQILYLVPEINLTPQTILRLEQRFSCPIILLHSTLSPKKKAQHWLMAKTHSPSIILGTRSAIFTPANLGLIIIDEEHDVSFKQQTQNRYCAKNLAIIRAQQKNIPIILGSATPSFVSLANIKKKNFQHLIIRTNPYKIKPALVQLIDLKKEKLNQGLSIQAIQLIKDTLAKQQQILLFINRRGFAPCLMCIQCGWLYRCHRCEKLMTYHKTKGKIICHHCEKIYSFSKKCPNCQEETLKPLGQGTERLELHLQSLFPNYPILRIDRDSTKKKGALEEKLAHIHTQEPMVLIGTQMLAKGHHFKNLSAVIITDIDMGLHSNDIFATEHLAQLLTQIFGRAGRQQTQGQVILQTHYPDHPMLQLIIKKNYFAYAQQGLQERKLAQLPPFHHLSLLIAQAYQEKTIITFLNTIKEKLLPITAPSSSVLGPMTANMQKKQGRFRAYLLIQDQNRPSLQHLLKKLLTIIPNIKKQANVHWSIEVDPREML